MYMNALVSTPTVQATMTVASIVALHPSMAEIMAEYGLHCFSCHMGGRETLREGMAMHGYSQAVLQALLIDLNEALTALPGRPHTVHVTTSAAQALYDISLQEQHTEHVVHIVADGVGSFCMEFGHTVGDTDISILVPEVPQIQFFVSPETVWFIGGSTVEYADGKFSLVQPAATCCQKTDSSCACTT